MKQLNQPNAVATASGMSLTFWRRILQVGAQMSRWRVSSLANCSDWVSRRVCKNLRMRQRSWLGKSWAGLKKQKRTRLVLISTRSPVKQKRTRLVSISSKSPMKQKRTRLVPILRQVTYEAKKDQMVLTSAKSAVKQQDTKLVLMFTESSVKSHGVM